MWNSVRQALSPIQQELVVVALSLAVWTAYWTYFFSRVIQFKSDGLYIGHVTAYGDWAMHLTWVSTFAYRTLQPSVHPLLITAEPQYPFVVNLISGLLIRLGIDFWVAFLLPVFLITLALLPLLLVFYKLLGFSYKVGLVAATLFFLNGGMGLWNWYLERSESSRLPTSFTIQETQGYVWGNIIHTQLIPQRAMALGLPVSLLILILFYVLFIKRLLRPRVRIAVSIGSIALCSLLPVIHTHSFIAVGFILGVWILWLLVKEFKNWSDLRHWGQRQYWQDVLAWGAVAALGSLAIFSYFIGWSHDQSFLSWYPGWYSHQTGQNWLALWWQNWTIMPLLSLSGLYLLWRENKDKFFLLLPCFGLFLLGNLILFQPYPFDNTKIFTYASVGMSVAASLSIKKIWCSHILGKALATALVVFVIGAGFADQVLTVRQLQKPFLYYSTEELELAEWVKHNTDKDAVFVTDTRHNSWLYNLTGRQVLMGYEGWLWSYGFEYGAAKQDIGQLMNGLKVDEISDKYTVTYLLLPSTPAYFSSELESNYSPVLSTQNYLILRRNGF